MSRQRLPMPVILRGAWRCELGSHSPESPPWAQRGFSPVRCSCCAHAPPPPLSHCRSRCAAERSAARKLTWRDYGGMKMYAVIVETGAAPRVPHAVPRKRAAPAAAFPDPEPRKRSRGGASRVMPPCPSGSVTAPATYPTPRPKVDTECLPSQTARITSRCASKVGTPFLSSIRVPSQGSIRRAGDQGTR